MRFELVYSPVENYPYITQRVVDYIEASHLQEAALKAPLYNKFLHEQYQYLYELVEVKKEMECTNK